MQEVLEQQHGLFTVAQAVAAGIRHDSIRRRTGSGVWERLSARVVRVVGCPETFEQRCLAGVLDVACGAVVSHHSAAALWQIPGFAPRVVEVSVPHVTGRVSPLADVHQTNRLPAHHVTTLHGIPLTTVARTLFDLAGSVHPKRAERALDNALARRLTTLEAVREVFADLAGPRRAGTLVMRALLAERAEGYQPPESALEAKFLQILREAGLPLPEPQRHLGGEQWVGRVDFVYPSRRLVIEIDSSLHHSTALDRAADERRDRELRAAGYEVERIREEVVWQAPGEVVVRVRSRIRVAA